jgi:signal transduction histidine kinase
MESVGTLAGGVAHDFNNILNIIKGYAGLIGQNPSVDEKVAESLNVIEETVERGAYGVRQLLTLAQTEARLALTNPNDSVGAKQIAQADVSENHRGRFGTRCQITIDIGGSKSNQSSAAKSMRQCS